MSRWTRCVTASIWPAAAESLRGELGDLQQAASERERAGDDAAHALTQFHRSRTRAVSPCPTRCGDAADSLGSRRSDGR